MKMSQFILILFLIGFCLAEEPDECSIQFEKELEKKCLSIHSSCRFTDLTQRCIKTDTCGTGTSDTCSGLIPSDFHRKKCFWETDESTGDEVCNEVDKTCTDYNKNVGSIQIKGDECSELTPKNDQGTGDDDGNRCAFDSSGNCRGHYDICTNINDLNKCNNNVPSDSKSKCVWDIPEGECQTFVRYCDEYDQYNINENICSQLELRYSGTKCIYFNNGCVEAKILCENYYDSTVSNPADICNGNTPLVTNGNEYDYKYICKYNSASEDVSPGCKPVLRTCEEYTGDDETICLGLQATNSNKRCIFDPDSITNKCREEYKTCELYSDNEIDKTRRGCENLILPEENRECVYIPEEDKCIGSEIYEYCEEYGGSDKKICESIISPKTHFNCILDKDSKCKEREFLCSEVTDEENCLYYAKASSSNKRCAYNGTKTIDKCYEEYLTCENYEENDSSICSEIILYNGKECEFESNRCKSRNKKCHEVTTKEECDLIAKTGVTNPDKKVCYFTGSACIETYKYCSDYRETCGTNCQSFCNNNIRPYDDTGENLDLTFKCIYEAGVGCQKVPKECSDANNNPFLCSLISPISKDNKVKYCAYIGNTCQSHYKTCESYEGTSETYDSIKADICTSIIPENYLANMCEYKYNSTEKIYKCVAKTDCSLFNPADYAYICHQINPNCAYSYIDKSCKKEEKSCSNTIFYKVNENNEEICKNMQTSVPYKNCSIKEDKSRCEEVFNYSYIYPNTSTKQESSSTFMEKGIYFLLILLCLLI